MQTRHRSIVRKGGFDALTRGEKTLMNLQLQKLLDVGHTVVVKRTKDKTVKKPDKKYLYHPLIKLSEKPNSQSPQNFTRDIRGTLNEETIFYSTASRKRMHKALSCQVV